MDEGRYGKQESGPLGLTEQPEPAPADDEDDIFAAIRNDPLLDGDINRAEMAGAVSFFCTFSAVPMAAYSAVSLIHHGDS